jgi:EpsI family protein
VRGLTVASGIATALMLAAGALLLRPSAPGAVLPGPSLTAWVGALPGWRPDGVPPSALLTADPRAAASLVRGYLDGTATVWLALDYYADQHPNARPAARHLVFAGRGWTEFREREHAVPLRQPAGTTVPVTLVEMRRGDERYALIYWYQAGARSAASDHWYRLLALYNRLVHGRRDGALVRIAVREGDGGLTEALAKQAEFVNAFYPELLRVMSAAGGVTP